jgi:hypothetical protein
MSVKQTLISRTASFDEIFGKCLNSLNYIESNINIVRLENEESEFPNIPAIEVQWINKSLNQTIEFRLYQNFICDLIIKSQNGSISINDYKKFKKISGMEMYLMNGKIEEKYKLYLIKILDLIKSTELNAVLEGRSWINVPYDWQDLK